MGALDSSFHNKLIDKNFISLAQEKIINNKEKKEGNFEYWIINYYSQQFRKTSNGNSAIDKEVAKSQNQTLHKNIKPNQLT